MVRTQIQLPDELFERAKRFAETREISLAEVVRRALEAWFAQHPEVTPDAGWELPTIEAKLRVPLQSLKELAYDDEAREGDEPPLSLVAEDES